MIHALAGAVVAAALQTAPAADSAAPTPPPPPAVTAATPLVGAAVLLPFGAAHDPPGASGMAWVYGRLLEEELREALAGSAATTRVRVGRFDTEVTLLAPPGTAAADLDRFQTVVDARRVDGAALERVQADLVRQLRFEEGAPVRTFEEERAALIFDGRWGASLQGRRAELETLGAADVERWRSTPRDEAAVWAVVAPPGSPLARPQRPDSGQTAAGAPRTRAWSEGRHERLDRPITNAWVTVDAPVRADLDPTVLDLYVRHLEEVLSPTPPDPGLYSADVELLHAPEGPVLSITAAVTPEAAERWARRLEAAVLLEDLESWRDERQFAWLRRRFRNAWLAREASPDRAAARVARDLRAGRSPRVPLEATQALDAGDLDVLTDAIGPTRVLIYGPVLDPPADPPEAPPRS
ncbi:MAG: hypothetical protein R3E98_15825 [Gemmatimonadota bacterium]